MIQLTVYGAEQLCASCVQAPSSKETFEWLQAAIGRKFYDTNHIVFTYIDIFSENNGEEHEHWIEQIKRDELFYPAVVVNGTLVDEGVIRIQKVYQAIQERFDQIT
ncbi:hypothetical protein BN1058_02603 [Paraliobacillus sp. PM-2]|uniref:YuzD family protein n=1 Tax=Paraliobacillus sp. PM-2 TaxID=1462524 RepID=UPI00061C11B0|nr:YuzD family protein [Paraliobacillus sp. PM-2]CQR48249.1 hypothetical protein BN1058_02603 [Paraliobacillus sp. PM-2]